MKEKFVKAYLNVAKIFADLSTATKLKVGAIVVKDNRIISIGYNGTPSGWDNNCEDIESTFDERDTYFSKDWTFNENDKKYYRLKTKPEVIHAERNALDKLAKLGGVGGEGASIFITHAPCIECSKSIYNAGIKEIYYEQDYRSPDGVYFLKKCGINVTKVSDINN